MPPKAAELFWVRYEPLRAYEISRRLPLLRSPFPTITARTCLLELVAVHDQGVLIGASQSGLLDEVCPKVPEELPVLAVAVLRGELPQPPQELVVQHQRPGLQLVNTNSQLTTGVQELAGLQERQEKPGGGRDGICRTMGVCYLQLNHQRWSGFIHFKVSNCRSYNWESPNYFSSKNLQFLTKGKLSVVKVPESQAMMGHRKRQGPGSAVAHPECKDTSASCRTALPTMKLHLSQTPS